MKSRSRVTAIAMALVFSLTISTSSAAKCNVKTSAPVATEIPLPTIAPSPPMTPPPTKKTPTPTKTTPTPTRTTPTTPTTPTPAAADNDNNALGSRSSGCGTPAAIATGAFKIAVNGQQRDYTVRVPRDYDATRAYAMVFTFHWRDGTMQDAAKLSGGYYGLEALANESTIFVSPQGLDGGWANVGGRDIALVDAIVKKLDASLCVATRQRFATGFSYGAAMSHAVACARPDAFRGVSVIAGGPFSGCADQTNKKPIAYMVSHGVSDTNVPIANGRQLRDHFVKTNGCTAVTAPEPAAGSGTHTKTEYKGCTAGYPVVYIAFDGGHTATPADKGKKNWAPSETWQFFTQFM